MRNNILLFSFYFVALIFFQILVLNNMQFSSYLNPYCYVLLILILPFDTPGWLLLSIAFFLGMTMDVFPQGWTGAGASLGFHTFATVLVAFIRPFVLKWINPRDEYEIGSRPGASDFGLRWYLTYSLIIVGIHHFTLFLLESMSFVRIPETFLRTILSASFTLLLILLWEGLRFRRN
ncbi:MAG: hypothetical protein KAH17_07135 [Bacteroidales bacterium]|nr:hypothetical protein [Bacteroidales bacterium]